MGEATVIHMAAQREKELFESRVHRPMRAETFAQRSLNRFFHMNDSIGDSMGTPKVGKIIDNSVLCVHRVLHSVLHRAREERLS